VTSVVAVDETQRRLRSVRRPRPLLGRQRERELTDRQREILDEMEDLVAGGFADLTMAELAARLNCSLRTLYALAPSRDELVLIVIDHR
jgi:AcrR family transcriptional regulator